MTDSPLVHGLAADWVAPDWPPPSAAELREVLAAFGFEAAGAPCWSSPRPLSSAQLVPVGATVVLVKRHHRRVRDADDLRQEHRFADHLRSGGLPTPLVHRTPEGDSVVVAGQWRYEVHAAAAGTDRYREAMSWTPFATAADARAAGRTLARLHLAAESFHEPERGTTVLSSRPDSLRSGSLRGSVDDFLAEHPASAPILGRVRPAALVVLEEPLAKVPRRLAALSMQWVHNDWHASNLFWDGHQVSSVIDFGLADLSYPVVDLAIALERNAIRWLELPVEDIAEPIGARELINGYVEVRPLSEVERDLLPDLVPVCHLDFALSEVDYFAGVLRDPSRAEVAWRDYAVGHAAWFTTGAGQEFLAGLRNRLSD